MFMREQPLRSLARGPHAVCVLELDPCLLESELQPCGGQAIFSGSEEKRENSRQVTDTLDLGDINLGNVYVRMDEL